MEGMGDGSGSANSDSGAFDDDQVVKQRCRDACSPGGLWITSPPCTAMAFFLAHVGTAVTIPMFPKMAVKMCLASNVAGFDDRVCHSRHPFQSIQLQGDTAESGTDSSLDLPVVYYK